MLEKVDLTLEIGDALGFFLGVDQLALAVLDLAAEEPDLLHLLLVVDLPLLQGRLLNLDLLVQQVQLLVSLNQLC